MRVVPPHPLVGDPIDLEPRRGHLLRFLRLPFPLRCEEDVHVMIELRAAREEEGDRPPGAEGIGIDPDRCLLLHLADGGLADRLALVHLPAEAVVLPRPEPPLLQAEEDALHRLSFDDETECRFLHR